MSDFFLGLDLGQAADFSALAALERTELKPDPLVRPTKHHACRALQRWPLGTPYPNIVADVAKTLKTPALQNAHLVIDGTGVGRPVVDMFINAKLPAKLVPVLITAGHKVHFTDGYWHVPKVILIGTVQVLLQERRMQFAQGLPETETLVGELNNYRVKITPGLHESFNARDGAHDDLVLALALAAWQAERAPSNEPSRIVTLRQPLVRT